jgi:hypothetical protein
MVHALTLILQSFPTLRARSRQAKHGSPVSSSAHSWVSHLLVSSPGSASARRSPRKLLPHHQQQPTTRSLQHQRVRTPHHNTIRRLCSSKVPAWLRSVLLMANKTHGLLSLSRPSAKRLPRARCPCMVTSILSRAAMQAQDSQCIMRQARV